VIELSDVDTTEAPLLDDYEPPPEELAEQLHQFYLRDVVDIHGVSPVSFTELLLAEKFDFTHPTLQPGYVPINAVQPAPSTMGNLAAPRVEVDPKALVASMFASMGQQ
jgi:hypothetical protein